MIVSQSFFLIILKTETLSVWGRCALLRTMHGVEASASVFKNK